MTFLIPLKLIAVFPPIDESIIDRVEDGILINFKPLLYVEEANPTKSPITPPPRAITISFLEKLCSNNFSWIFKYELKDLLSSPGLKIKVSTTLIFSFTRE